LNKKLKKLEEKLMKKVISILMIIVLILGLAGCAQGPASSGEQQISTLTKVQENKKIIIGTAPGYMPFEMKDVNGNFVGYDIDVGNAIGEALGVEVEWRQYEFAGLLPALQTGDIDLVLAGMAIRGNRALSVSFSNPYFETAQIMMVSSNDTTTQSWEDLDVSGKIIATSQGTTGGLLAKQLFKNAEVVDYDSFPTAAMAIAQGRAHGIVYEEPAVRFYEMMNDGVRGVYEPLTFVNTGMAIRHNDFAMINWVNSFLYGYIGSAKDLESVEKWFHSTDWMEDIQQN
jgi:polar amino acid transport system substrate-binding protein